MAIEYHLLTAFGTGKTATMTIASPCVVTYTAHGLSDGFKVVFTTTGALPTGITSGTTYYAKSTGANTFNLYTDASLTTIVNTSGSQSGIHTIYSEYWYNLPATDPGSGGNYRARYGAAGSERVFGEMRNWLHQLPTNADITKSVCLEIEGRWTDTYDSYTAGKTISGYFAVTITTKVNGVYGSGFHGGILGGGYKRIVTANTSIADFSSQLNATVDGVEVVKSYASAAGVVIGAGTGLVVSNCILKNTYAGTGGGITTAAGCLYYNNLIHGCAGVGLTLTSYQSGAVLLNNTIVGCGVGIQGTNAYIDHVIGNVCIGNSTNWGTAPSGGYWANNGGAAGDTIWTTSGMSNITGLTSADFRNYVVPVDETADFSPSGDSAAHTSSSLLVDAGSQLIPQMVATDIRDNARPSYKNGAATGWDIGAYEFDWGYGPAPSSVSISITGMASGSEIAIYKASDMSVILAPQSTTGSYSGTYTYTGDTNIIVRVRKGTSVTRYLPYEYAGTITSTGFQLVVSQIPDTIAQ